MPLGKKQFFCNCGVIYKLRRDSSKSLFKGQQKDSKGKSTSDLHGPHGSTRANLSWAWSSAYPACPAMHLPVFLLNTHFISSSVFSLKSFGLPARHVLRENMFEGAFPQFSGFQIAACFGVITACLGVNAACFPGRPKNWFLRGADTGKLVWFRWWGLKVICCNLLAHVHEIEYRCMWAVKWVASNPQMVDRDAPITNLQGQQTKHIKSKVVWFSVTATFYQLRRVLDNAACSGKCRQNFSSIPLRPKFWQHESIGMSASFGPPLKYLKIMCQLDA